MTFNNSIIKRAEQVQRPSARAALDGPISFYSE